MVPICLSANIYTLKHRAQVAASGKRKNKMGVTKFFTMNFFHIAQFYSICYITVDLNHNFVLNIFVQTTLHRIQYQ